MGVVWKYIPLSKIRACVYAICIIVVFIFHFKIADDYTFNHSKYSSTERCEFGCFGHTKLSKFLTWNNGPLVNSVVNYDDKDLKTDENNNIINKNLLNSAVIRKSTNSMSKLNEDVVTIEGETTLGVEDEEEKENKDKIEENIINNNNNNKTLPMTLNNKPLYQAPRGEERVKRFPQVVIAGFTKCGTRALIDFLSPHPYIKIVRNELHFYDKDEIFARGYDWYKDQMPYSYSNQITIEKTPAYILTERARDGMYNITPNAKLILLVRDPVIRMVSQFIQRFSLDNTVDLRPVSDIFTNFTTRKFDPLLRPVDIGNYQKHIYMWLRYFPLKHMLILNSEDLTLNPLSVIKKVETFIQLPRLFSEWNVYYNKSSGFYCPRGFDPTAKPSCLGKSKGLPHPKLKPGESEMLYEYYKPLSDKLFRLIGYPIKWTESQWGKVEDDKVDRSKFVGGASAAHKQDSSL